MEIYDSFALWLIFYLGCFSTAVDLHLDSTRLFNNTEFVEVCNTICKLYVYIECVEATFMVRICISLNLITKLDIAGSGLDCFKDELYYN